MAVIILFHSDNTYTCYTRVQGQSGGTGQTLRHRCCYVDSDGSLLLQAPPVGGRNTYARFPAPTMDTDDQHYLYCCQAGYINKHESYTDFCVKFKDYRPVSDFKQFKASAACKFRMMIR